MIYRIMKSLLSAVMLVIYISSNVQAEDKSVTVKKVMDMVRKAVKLIQEKGPDIAFPIISDPNGEFVDGELYVFSYNIDGTIVQHLRPELVGKNMMSVKDKYGKCFACDFIKIAREQGEGWSQYWWSKPGSSELSLKVSYIMKVPNMDYLSGVGVYDMTIEDVKNAIEGEKKD